MSNAQPGVSEYAVHNIVRGYVAPLQQQLNQLESEMSNVEGAIQNMHRSLDQRLAAVVDTSSKLVHIQESTRDITREQFVAANAQLAVSNHNISGLRDESKAGFSNVVTDLRVVDADMRKMTGAIVQMEVIRLLNEAKGPIERLKSFGEEIDQRFAKAVENVYFVRVQYDQLLTTSMNEYEKKLHTIGDHIYGIYEQDFRPFAEVPMTTAPDSTLELALSVDDARVDARAEALESNISAVKTEVLEPLLQAQRQFEHTLASGYATRLSGLEGEYHVPIGVSLFDDPANPARFVASASVNSSDGELRSVRLDSDPAAREMLGAIGTHAREIARSATTQKLPDDSLSKVKTALRDLAQRGLIDEALLPGYDEYLDTYGLDVVWSGELELR